MNPNRSAIARNHPDLQRMIPITRLRHFYRLLRDTVVSKDAHLCVAEEFRRNPQTLQNLVEESRLHFALYNNSGEGFHPREPLGALSTDVSKSPNAVHEMLRCVKQHGLMVPSHPAFNAGYVDYELSPIRTTTSEYENGIPSQARGGVDVLLANEGDRLPVLVEAKGKKDRNLFLGLIQLLTYAVEFSTISQRQRINETYPERFAWQPDGPALDVYLLLVEAPSCQFHPTFLGLVEEICGKILTPGSAVAGVVRRIVCLETDMSGTEAIPVAVKFCHGPGS